MRVSLSYRTVHMYAAILARTYTTMWENWRMKTKDDNDRLTRLLIDRSLENWALRAEGVVRTETMQWGPHEVISDVHGYRAKELPQDEWRRRQIESLPTIARMAREGQLTFCTSVELKFESFRAANGWQGYIGDLFRDIKFENVPAAVERSYFWQTINLDDYSSGEGQVRWYKDFLLKADEDKILAEIADLIDLPDFDRQNLKNVSRFREMCRHLETDDHIRDAFHLWTAETNGLDYFLTADKRFTNKMMKSTPLKFPAPPIGPADLLVELGITELDSLPLTDRGFRYLFDPEE